MRSLQPLAPSPAAARRRRTLSARARTEPEARPSPPDRFGLEAASPSPPPWALSSVLQGLTLRSLFSPPPGDADARAGLAALDARLVAALGGSRAAAAELLRSLESQILA